MRFTKDEIRKAMLLYAVTDSSWLKEGQTLAEVVEDVLANGATFLQIREKEMEHGAFLAEARQLQATAAKHHVPFVVNDSVEVALACDADGVHVQDIRQNDEDDHEDGHGVLLHAVVRVHVLFRDEKRKYRRAVERRNRNEVEEHQIQVDEREHGQKHEIEVLKHLI